ncbi:hypothetical protein M3Y94_00935500 [Aphelenchoides besseyi]|nr:hypothetical protein M3Y94_00935500 [Aphelenchoides besseyi]
MYSCWWEKLYQTNGLWCIFILGLLGVHCSVDCSLARSTCSRSETSRSFVSKPSISIIQETTNFVHEISACNTGSSFLRLKVFDFNGTCFTVESIGNGRRSSEDMVSESTNEMVVNMQ